MIANVSAHRRANAFAQAVDDAEPGQERAAAEAGRAAAETGTEGDQPALLALADGLARLPRPELDPEVKEVQRAQLVAAMEAMFAGGEATAVRLPEQRSGRGAHRASPLRKLRPRSRWSKGIAAGGLAAGVAAGAFSGVAAASSDALPGDTLYGLKRGMEDARLGLTDSDADRGSLYLDQASTRFNEARRLMDRGRSGSLDHESLGEVRRALSGMRHDASEGHRLLHRAYEKDGSLGPIRELSAFTESHRAGWGRLVEVLPPQLGDVTQDVSDVFADIENEVAPHKGSLLPEVPERGRTARPDTPAPGSSPTGRHRADPSTGPTAGRESGRKEAPAPSSPDARQEAPRDEGLLGGATGDLLDPPQSTPSGPESPSDRGGDPSVAPDVTIPPLLPDILPGLGIDGEDL
ncbi:DUF5667 domain-containing protein [Streptomyces sp. NPDC060194]|uniref:DUF5667 domain-containing protein n=1 Tax=Streptomyces sp. NPDC060194 TaxID=3347069 RepID=UPI003647BDB0